MQVEERKPMLTTSGFPGSAAPDHAADPGLRGAVGGAGGANVDESATDSGERNGTEYRCVPLVGMSVRAAACMWREDDTVGIVVDLSAGIDDTRELLFTVRDTIT